MWDSLLELYREEINHNPNKKNIFSSSSIQYTLYCKQCFLLYKDSVSQQKKTKHLIEIMTHISAAKLDMHISLLCQVG